MQLAGILVGALKWNRFPTFCALLAGGSTLLPLLLNKIIATLFNLRKPTDKLVLVVKLSQFLRFISVFLTAWVCFPILNSKRRSIPEPRDTRVNTVLTKERAVAQAPTLDGQFATTSDSDRPDLAGRTLDLTLFATVRAVDVLICVSWSRWKRLRRSHNRWTHIESIMPQLFDTGVFAVTAATVMWAWFYLPERLPFSYSRWISDMAQSDPRLINALRSARRGDWTYGKPKGSLLVLEPMCEDYGLPRAWGDPSQTVPIPCEVVHMGHGRSCEAHALWRFAESFKLVFKTNFPILLLLRLRSPSLGGFIKAVKDALRSSAFLGLFVSAFYYSMCLARTRLGPRLFNYKQVTPMMWDSGLCIAAGCMTSGWSILVESPKRRAEISLFVAPRAIATFFPRRYDRKVSTAEWCQ